MWRIEIPGQMDSPSSSDGADSSDLEATFGPPTKARHLTASHGYSSRAWTQQFYTIRWLSNEDRERLNTKVACIATCLCCRAQKRTDFELSSNGSRGDDFIRKHIVKMHPEYKNLSIGTWLSAPEVKKLLVSLGPPRQTPPAPSLTARTNLAFSSRTPAQNADLSGLDLEKAVVLFKCIHGLSFAAIESTLFRIIIGQREFPSRKTLSNTVLPSMVASLKRHVRHLILMMIP